MYLINVSVQYGEEQDGKLYHKRKMDQPYVYYQECQYNEEIK